MKRNVFHHHVYLCRHGETEWTLSGQHTSRTDIPLTPEGERQAQKLKARLQGVTFARVWVSPRKRAQQTCHFAGFEHDMEPLSDLAEWDYGEYEGLTTPAIRIKVPGWTIFRNGAPGGETSQQIQERADRVIKHIYSVDGDVALFSHGHFSRVLAARWLELPVEAARHLDLSTASLSIFGYGREDPVLSLWNETSFLQ